VVQELEMLCMAATPMHEDFSIDEDGLRTHLRRLVAARNGIYLGSGGAGEGHSLSPAELRRVYEIGVEEARGKVPVYANPRESRTAEAMYEVAKQAVEAGVDMVQLYQVDAGHGMVPTLAEQEAYFSYLLDRIEIPVALSMHVFSGFLATPALLAKLCERYPQIKAINVMGPPDRYFMQLRDTLPASVRLYTGIAGLPTLATLGAVGALSAENNCIPNVCRRVGDAITAGDREWPSPAPPLPR
jgi:4-hydroxy-tetrahydrodipicolinate synthase